VLFGMAIEQLLQQQRDVVGPIPQGGRLDGVDVL
jgi:hypothetical protein